MISGKKIFLSAIEKEDLPKITNWRNSPLLRINFREHRELDQNSQEKWYKKILKNENDYFWAIHENENSELIGVCGVNYINWINRNCQLSIYIGKDNVYIDNSGMAEEAVNIVLCYSFNVLNLHKVFAEIYEFDKKKQKMLENIGFKLEGELKEHSFKDGKYFSSYIYSIIK